MSVADSGRRLVPAVVQDAVNGRVLMVGYMDDEAVAQTRATGQVHFWSRSRQRLWKKGETSGHVLELVDLTLDCDRDTYLVRARPVGPTCHTGSRTCFGVDGAEPPPHELEALYETILARKAAPAGARSYVKQLIDEGRAGEKILEEASELVAELPDGSRERVISETADLIFHLLVGLATREITLDDVAGELARRAGRSGLDEKAARGKG